jgi:hypothetical protein
MESNSRTDKMHLNPSLHYQSYCEHSRNFASVNFKFWRICKKCLRELTWCLLVTRSEVSFLQTLSSINPSKLRIYLRKIPPACDHRKNRLKAPSTHFLSIHNFPILALPTLVQIIHHKIIRDLYTFSSLYGWCTWSKNSTVFRVEINDFFWFLIHETFSKFRDSRLKFCFHVCIERRNYDEALNNLPFLYLPLDLL